MNRFAFLGIHYTPALWLFLFAVGWSAHAETELVREFEQDVQPFLQRYCVDCHNPDNLMSGVRLDQLTAKVEDRHLKLFAHVRSQIADNKMPPAAELQPSEEERRRVLNWIARGLAFARTRPTPKNGGTRRLTVAQYRNTLRELLLLDENLAEILPADAISKDGFANNQENLILSPLLVETYFEIAEKALDRCIIDVNSKPSIQNFRMDLGKSINLEPCPEPLILGALSLLLENADFRVTQLIPSKPFPFEPLRMQTKFRFNEGYAGNDTVRGWREYDSIYHAVFACMRGNEGYPKGLAYSTVPEGLLLRPAIPSAEVFDVESTYGPRANFKISLRELPDHGRFRVTVRAAKYNDGLLLDPGTEPTSDGTSETVVWDGTSRPNIASKVSIPHEGIFQIDVHAAPSAAKSDAKKSNLIAMTLGQRQFAGNLDQPAFLVTRIPAGEMAFDVKCSSELAIERVVFTPLDKNHEIARKYVEFERRTPQLGVHLGVRRDCGSTLNPVGSPQPVRSNEISTFIFEDAIRNFPSPDVQKDNDNYLAGIREIGVRSEYTDGRDMPRLLIQSVEFEGPFYDSWPPATHRNIFGDSPLEEASLEYARKVIREFATRAFRRPLAEDEEAALVNVFERSRNEGGSFVDSIKDALLVVLTAPQFLFLIENSSTPSGEPLENYELASKLSYFLWNGPPDEMTLKLAKDNQLRDQLDAEVRRLLAADRSARFIDEFVSQWLALEKFDVLEPNRERFPKLTSHTREQLRKEPIQFIQHLIRHNLPVSELIRSDFIVANDIVANFYDVTERPSSGFEFVALPHVRSDLGGILSQAAILAGLSDGRESNPVKRGAWLARRVIAEPPDDPPPNVPELKDETRHLSLRERLEQHRNQMGCAKCHSAIDPWGVPFEVFDAGGRWKAAPVDARSTLPDKTEVQGFSDLRRYLAEDRLDQVAFSVLKHLATYATGRSLTFNEMELLKQEGQKLKATGYPMQDMIRLVVKSPIFLEK